MKEHNHLCFTHIELFKLAKELKMNILIISEFLSENLGDQAIYFGLINIIGLNNNVTSIDLSGRNETIAKETKEIDSIKYMIPSFILKMKNIFVSLYKYIKSRENSIKKIQQSDLIIIGGGSLLINNNLSFPVKLFLLTELIKKNNKNYIIIGCSTRENNGVIGEFLLRKVLTNSNAIGVRDIKSLNILISKKYKPFFIGDPALLLPKKKHIVDGKSLGRRIAINIMSIQKHGMLNIHIHQYYITLLDSVIEKFKSDYEITLFSTGDLPDNHFIKRKYLSKYEIYIPSNLENLNNFISEHNIIIATRLHASIISISQEKIPFGLSWDEKVKGFFTTYLLDNYYIDLTKKELTKDINKIHEYISLSQRPYHTNLAQKIKRETLEQYKAQIKNYM